MYQESVHIAFDLDGVLADLGAELNRQAEILFGDRRVPSLGESDDGTAVENPDPNEPVGTLDDVQRVLKLSLTAREQRQLWRRVASIENFWESLGETEPGVISRLAMMAMERRWETIFLTKRPETAGATAQVQSQRWLESRGFRLPSVYVVQGSRGRIAAALGLEVVIDDRPENCLDVVVDSKARAILVWRDDAKALPSVTKRLGIEVVNSVRECLDIMGAVDASSERSRMLGHLKRALGLKEPIHS